MNAIAKCRATDPTACRSARCPERFSHAVAEAISASSETALLHLRHLSFGLEPVAQAKVDGYLQSLAERQALVRQEICSLAATQTGKIDREVVRSVVNHHLLPVVGWLRLAAENSSVEVAAGLRTAIDEQVRALTALLNRSR